MPLFPTITTEDEFDALVEDPAAGGACLAALATRLGIHESFDWPARGSALVGLTGTEVLKLFSPLDHAFADNEQLCLTALSGALPVQTPELIDAGTLEGWPWIRMRRLPGRKLAEAWPELAGRVDLSAGRTGWLHTEVMREHLLVEQRGGQWVLCGLFDFEPSWAGPVDYEFSSVAAFFSAGDRQLLAAVQRAAGVDIDPERLFLLFLLHRYGGLGWVAKRLGGPPTRAAWIERFFGAD